LGSQPVCPSVFAPSLIKADEKESDKKNNPFFVCTRMYLVNDNSFECVVKIQNGSVRRKVLKRKVQKA
jgi:hypothetical protein